MSKYISIFFLNVLFTIMIFFSIGVLGMFETNGVYMAISIGAFFTLQSSFIVALLFYVIDLVKKQDRK
ncbi:MAG TPA: hypothetical protein VJ558_08740 [Bacillales bacterium]|jgi:hypothetical protein|nr:hypothetical protein [Bacillales bacterium]